MSFQVTAEQMARKATMYSGYPLRAQWQPGKIQFIMQTGQLHSSFALGGVSRRMLVEVYGRLSHTGLRIEEVNNFLRDTADV
jgi:hypothetical protein